MKKIQINGNEYNIKYTIRSLFIFEQITGKAFKIETLLDNYVFFYSMLLACNPDNIITWDGFIDALDADPNLFVKINDVVTEQQGKDELLNGGDDTDNNDPQKKS